MFDPEVRSSAARALVFWLLVMVPGTVMGDFSLSGGTAESEILPVDEAFRFGFYEEGEGIRLFWQVMPGYFLYRDKFRFRDEGLNLDVSLPEGTLHDDETFGQVQVFDGLLELSIPAHHLDDGLEVYYQGCAEQGYCYPPQKKLLSSAKIP